MAKKHTRAVRRAHKRRVAAKRRKLMLAKRQDHLAKRSDNELAERHPLDCGSRCLMCHGEKLLDGSRRRRRLRAESEREVLEYVNSLLDPNVPIRMIGR
jgi:hypothetical protein